MKYKQTKKRGVKRGGGAGESGRMGHHLGATTFLDEVQSYVKCLIGRKKDRISSIHLKVGYSFPLFEMNAKFFTFVSYTNSVLCLFYVEIPFKKAVSSKVHFSFLKVVG